MFGNRFLWGSASAGRQVEPALPGSVWPTIGGASDWEVFVGTAAITTRVTDFSRKAGFRQPIVYQQPGEGIGYDSLEVIRADLDRAQALGFNAWRFSVEWSRLQPDRPASGHEGDLDSTALAHYLGVIQELSDRAMTPVITLNHMSLPAWVLTPPAATVLKDPFVGMPGAAPDDGFNASLQGFENDATISAWEHYVTAFVAAVRAGFPTLQIHWLTLNEPIGSMVGVGYLGGIWAPGFTGETDRALRVCLGLVKAHERAWRVCKTVAPNDYMVGFAHAMQLAGTTSFSSAAAGAGMGAGVGGAIGALGGAACGAGLGLAVGAAICATLGPLALACLVVAVIAGLIAGAVAGGAVGAGLGAAIGAIAAEAGQLQQNAADQFDYYINNWVLEALANGKIEPTAMAGAVKGRTDADWDRIWIDTMGVGASPRGRILDFVGINYYRRMTVHWYPTALLVPMTGGVPQNDMEGSADPHGVLNELGWEIVPSGISTMVRRIHDAYRLPVLITENGVPEPLDANRGPNLVAHLAELESVMADPTDPPQVLGYLHWSLVDNWEWHEGFNPPSSFGLLSTSARDNAPANRITHGLSTTYRRQLGEGALALRGIIDADTAVGVATRIGRIATGGEDTTSGDGPLGVTWEGTVNGASAKLVLDVVPGGGPPPVLTGLLYYYDQNAWLALHDITWDAATRTLEFRHSRNRSDPRIPERAATLAMDNAGALTGTLTDTVGAAAAVSLGIPGLQGLWIASGPGAYVALAVYRLRDDGPVGKLLPVGNAQRWRAFRFTSEGPPATFALPGTGAMSAQPVANGDLILTDSTGAAQTFARAPSPLPLLG